MPCRLSSFAFTSAFLPEGRPVLLATKKIFGGTLLSPHLLCFNSKHSAAAAPRIEKKAQRNLQRAPEWYTHRAGSPSGQSGHDIHSFFPSYTWPLRPLGQLHLFFSPRLDEHFQKHVLPLNNARVRLVRLMQTRLLPLVVPQDLRQLHDIWPSVCFERWVLSK